MRSDSDASVNYMSKRLKSRIGLVLVGGYIIIFLFSMVSAYLGMFGEGLFFLTCPWSFMLFGTLAEKNVTFGNFQVFFFVFLLLCAFCNAVILYVAGLIMTMTLRMISKIQSKPLDSIRGTESAPQFPAKNTTAPTD